MQLYVWGKAPNPRRVRMYLAEKGLAVPMQDAGDGPQLSPSYKVKYPFAMVPMLELDDGTQIGEAMAICRYFETLHPTPALMGSDAREKAVIEMWERRAYDEGLIGAAEVFRNTHPAFKDRSLPGHSDAVPQVQALQARGRQRLRRFFEMLNRQLVDNEFVAGNGFSVADITALCAIDFAKIRAETPIPEDHGNLRRWHEAVSKRPSAAA
jgi:glutathione S-transferase